ncbi:unnamed protein product [Rhizophagus irregularis]|nr:unnamed protein product [Rhizophagus irregularis]
MWWDAPITEAYHKLFQTNKNLSDAEIEHVFKLQIQTDHPEKMRELSSSNGWSKLWDASYSIVLEYFRNHRNSYVRKIKDTVYTIFNLFTCKPNKFTGPEEVSKEELQIMDNVKFGITVILMLLDPTYDQPEVSSSKVQERMGEWDSDVVIQRWLKDLENNLEKTKETVLAD